MLDRSKIRFVYFDLDDTLLDHRHAELRAIEALHETDAAFASLPFEDFLAAYRTANASVWPAFSRGELNKAQAKSLRFRRTLDAVGMADRQDAAQLGDRYLEIYSRFWRWVAGAREAFLAVSGSLPVGLLTNGFSEIQRRKLETFPELERVARSIIISDELGVMKPNPGIFRIAETQAGVASDALLYVGDSFRSDVEGGLGAGWQVAWYGQASSDAGCFTFTDWRALLDVLEIP